MASSSKKPSIGLNFEMKETIRQFHDHLKSVESVIRPYLSKPKSDIHETLSQLDAAKLDLTAAYALNSLFWCYLNTCGVNPQATQLKQELDRIRCYMVRVKEIEDSSKAPKLDKPAAKRFVKSALWMAAQNQSVETKKRTSDDANLNATPSTSSKPKKKKKKKQKQK